MYARALLSRSFFFLSLGLASSLPSRAAEEVSPPVLPLSEVLKLAKDENQDVRVLLARAEEAKAQFTQALSIYMPHLFVDGSYTRNSVSGKFALPATFVVRDMGAPTGSPNHDPTKPDGPNNLEGNQTNYRAVEENFREIQVQKLDQLQLKVSLTQTIFSADQLIAVVSGNLGKNVAILQSRKGIQDLLFEVARAYLGIVQLKEKARVQAEFVKDKKKHETDARLAFSVGSQPKIELLRAEIERSKAENDLILATNALKIATLGLGRLLNRTDPFEVEMPAEQPPEPQASNEDALAYRLDYRAALLGDRVARQSRGLSFAKYVPSISAFGNYQIANNIGFTGRNDSFAGGLSFHFDIFDGLNREGLLREYYAQTHEAAAAVRSTQLRVLQDVDKAKVEIDNARVSLQKANEQVRLAKENSRLVKVRYDAKAATYLDLIDADTTLKAAELAEVAATVDGILAGLQLQKAKGTFAQGLF